MGRGWIFVFYDVPNSPSKIRVKLWREFKGMGAIYPPYSVCILPDNSRVRRKLENIRRDIEKHGTAVIFRARGERDVDEANVLKMFDEERRGELDEILEECEEFMKEIQHNIECGNVTAEEVEELEESLEGLNRWYKKVISRGVEVSSDSKVEESLRKCSEMLNSFAEMAQKRQDEEWRKRQQLESESNAT
jgi:uncharacterized protein YoxC